MTLNRVTEKDRRGLLKRTELDPLGRVVKVTRALGTPDEAAVERNTWDGNGNRETTTDAEGRVTRFVYDAANRLESRTDGFGTADEAKTTFAYDGAGNLLEERDARAVLLGEPWSVKRTYDALNRLETETDGEQNVTTYGYDPEGHRTSVTTPKGQTTTTTLRRARASHSTSRSLRRSRESRAPSPTSATTRTGTSSGMEDADCRRRRSSSTTSSTGSSETTRDPDGLNLVDRRRPVRRGRPPRADRGSERRGDPSDVGRARAARDADARGAGVGVDGALGLHDRGALRLRRQLESRARPRNSTRGRAARPARAGDDAGYDKLDRQTSETVTLQDETTSSVTTEY